MVPSRRKPTLTLDDMRRYAVTRTLSETTLGTVNSDVLEHFMPDFRRITTVERILGSPWPS